MSGFERPDVFGDVHLGYVVIETQKFAEWRRFGADAIGLHVDDVDNSSMRFRLDDHESRFLLQNGPAEDVVATGWEVDSHETFDEILRRAAERGLPAVEGSAEDAQLRGVERLWRLPGPKGIGQELFTRAVTTESPLSMLSSGFVTGEAGMGHVAITSREPETLHAYYGTLFDARLSDWIDEAISGVKLKIRFLRLNERHHSVAVANVRTVKIDPIRTRVQHLNIQAATLEDMVGSYERVKATGFDMALSVGQHTNDRELSYYAMTPSGFEWEVGWNPIVVTPELEATWEPTTYQGISIWGHTPVGQTVVDKLAQFKNAVRNGRAPEITVPELSGAAR
ncbi:2,3-dihydroxybiphenyl 1,2-dioxygenase [Marmoricola sp. OAE513]|uniref:VOC family protein n=1 Tax=Marmoricola sp. OAE513 TaxID=2817894 RepID=UPI001AE390A8